MAEIGKYNTLKVVKEVDFGIYLFDEQHGEILMPKRYVPENCKVDDELEVFLYLDSEDRIISTTEHPYVKVNEFALLKVVSISTVGAFLDWGLPKDLLLPFREQKQRLEVGDSLMVYVYLDAESKRLVASAKLDKFLDNVPPEYEVDQEVDLLICEKTDIGYKAIIQGLHWGILYKNEVFIKLEPGLKVKGFIKKVRDDEKIDLTLQKGGFEKIDDSASLILEHLKENKGKMKLNDKSSSEEISKVFGISKKTFKKAIGSLYKNKLIIIDNSGVKLV